MEKVANFDVGNKGKLITEWLQRGVLEPMRDRETGEVEWVDKGVKSIDGRDSSRMVELWLLQ